MACQRCKTHERDQRLKRSGKFDHYGIRCRTWHGAYLINAAELILELRPRKPIIITARSIDNYARFQSYSVTKKHLPHVDNSKPGIMATITAYKHPFRTVIEGHHRMENHRLDRTDWSCYVLTGEETHCIVAPICDCWKGVKA